MTAFLEQDMQTYVHVYGASTCHGIYKHTLSNTFKIMCVSKAFVKALFVPKRLEKINTISTSSKLDTNNSKPLAS